MTSSLFIVEDDAALADLMSSFLRQHGLRVAVEGRGERAVPRILAEKPDLVVLDLGLPGRDGLSICAELRARTPIPILILTARGDDADQIAGLERGADDYVAKPVKPNVLLARVRALLRRGRPAQDAPPAPPAPPARVEQGALVIDKGTRSCLLSGCELGLTSGEFELLWLLALNAGQALSRAFLYDALRAASYDDTDRSLDLRISRLRQKLAAASGGRAWIKTIRGVGYLFVTG